MKNLFKFLMTVAVLFTASCAKEDISSSLVANGESVEVTFSANLADLGTRAYGEGAHANTLQFFVYEWAQDGVGTYLPAVKIYTGETGTNVITKNGGNKFTFSLTLVKGMRYNILFWADKGDNSIYSVDSATGIVTADYDGVFANDESLDAFFGKLEDFDPATDAAEAKEITLKRPFAQLNAFTEDLAVVGQSGATLSQSALQVPVYTSLNLFSGNVVGDLTQSPILFDFNSLPAADNAQQISMNYLLAPAEKFTTNVEFLYNFTGKNVDFPETIYSYVPLKRNYRTNIKGKLLTQATDFVVEILPGFEGEPEGLVYDVWDGVSVTVPETTTENGETVYNVDSGSDLAWLANLVNGTTRATDPVYHIVLANDIDLAGHNWTPVGTEANNFSGTFDGQGHTIANLSIVETEAKEGKAYMGFFGYAKNATIKNITFNNVNINIPCLDIDHSQGHIGAVAGSLEGTSTIENVTVKGDITVYTTQTANGASRVAVIAGGNSYGNVTMKNVHVVAAEGSSLIANNNVGALAGQLQGKMVFENCSSNIDVTANKFFAGGLVGIAAGDSYIKNCHTTGNVAVVAGREGRHNDEYRVGGIAGGWADGKTKVFTLEGCSYTGTISGKNVDGTVAEPLDYAGYVGRGYTLANCAGSKVIIDNTEYVQVYNDVYGVYTVNGAYEVNSVADLKALANDVNDNKNTFEGKTVVLTADIDLNNENWTPIGYWETFNGTFDGQGHTISNLKHHGTTEDCYVGLFGYTENATLKNLTINNVDLKLVANASWAGGHMGALVGNIEGNTLIENITVTGCVKIEGDLEKAGAGRIGGVVGGNVCNATLKNIVVNASEGSFVKGNSSVGGIAGQLQDAGTHHISFENCSSNIDVYAQQFYAGGIIGLTAKNSSFTNCSASGNISVLAGRAGNDNDLYRVGAIAGGWDDGENNVLSLTGCSYDAKLSGASADGRTATAFDCAGFVGRGYSAEVGAKVNVNGTVYEYAGEGVYKIGESYVVNTADALIAALEKKYDVILGSDIKINPANMSNAYGKTGINVKYGQTIDGNGHTLNIKGAGGTWDSGINTTGGIIKNLTVTGSFRGIFINHTSEHSEKVVLENVTITGTVYTISCDQGLYQGIEATNCTFNGWTSFAKTAGEAKFVNCKFGEGSGYKYCRPYSNTEFVKCTFCPGFEVDQTRATVTFTECTWEE